VKASDWSSFVVRFQSRSHVPDRLADPDWTLLHWTRPARFRLVEEFSRQVGKLVFCLSQMSNIELNYSCPVQYLRVIFVVEDYVFGFLLVCFKLFVCLFVQSTGWILTKLGILEFIVPR